MQGMTLGLGDEIGAGASALSNLVKGKPVGNAYSQNLDQTRQTLSQYGKDKPFSAAGLQAVGSLPISLIPGPSFFPKAQGLGGAMLAGGANAAAMGGAYGFNTGEDGPLSRLVNAAKVAVPSAVVGATVPALFQGAKSVGNAFVHGGGPSDAALAANEAGYVLPPNMASDQPSIASQGLNMAGGKLKTEYLASEKNQEVTNRLASEALGLSPDAQLTEKTFKDIRATAGKAYEAVKGVNIPIAFKPLSANDEAGQAFQDAVSNLSDISGAVRAEFPEHAANEGIDACGYCRSDQKPALQGNVKPQELWRPGKAGAWDSATQSGGRSGQYFRRKAF
jgi:hypothetical protein